MIFKVFVLNLNHQLIITVSEAQLKMKEKYRNNDYAFILSNDYDKISKNIHKYMTGVRIPCKYCTKAFCNKKNIGKTL